MNVVVNLFAVLGLLFLQLSVVHATCGNGSVGNGICPDGTCCSQWGWCGTTPDHCFGPTPAPVAPTPTAPPISIPQTGLEDTRLIAYLGNWQPCPTMQHVSAYTHIMIAFAVSYVWSPGQNICSSTCEISTPPVCDNVDRPDLITEWQNAGKKVLLSFGGAGMGGSWDGNNDCWEYCFGRETQVINRVTEIINDMGLDGVDIDYEYYYEDGQNGSNFSKGAEAQFFLREVTLGLKNSLNPGSIITHAPMDGDVVPGTAYFDVLVDVAPALDFLLPQYYNGLVLPALTGFGPSSPAITHFNAMKDSMFGGDATKIVVGFCIVGCIGVADASTAVSVMDDLAQSYPCNGGAFFWVAHDDVDGNWSFAVGSSIFPNAGCSLSDPPSLSPSSTPSIETSAPTATPSSTPIIQTISPATTPSSAPIIQTNVPSITPCVEDADAVFAGMVASPNTIFATCGQLSQFPQYIDYVCNFDPKAAATALAPASVCGQTCGTGGSENPNSDFLVMLIQNGQPKLYEFTCGFLSQQSQGIKNAACNVDLSAWDTYVASTVCCETCPSVAPPTSLPTPSPTTTPSALPTILASSFPTITASSFPTSSPTTTPTTLPTTNTLEPTIPILNPIMCCPVAFTGLKSYNNCANYYNCLNGVVTGQSYDCPSGTLFLNIEQSCVLENQFTCDESPCNDDDVPSASPVTSTPSSTNEPTFTSAPTNLTDQLSFLVQILLELIPALEELLSQLSTLFNSFFGL